MSDPFRSPKIFIANEGFSDETGLLSYVLADANRQEIARAVETDRKNPLLMRIAPPIEPKPFRFELLLRTAEGVPLLKIEKRQRFPQRVWARVSEPSGEVLGFMTGPWFPLAPWAFEIKDSQRARLARIRRKRLSYTCHRDGAEVATVEYTRDWTTKVPGTRDFFHRFGNEYTIQISDEVQGALRTLLAVFPVIGDLSRNEMADRTYR